MHRPSADRRGFLATAAGGLAAAIWAGGRGAGGETPAKDPFRWRQAEGSLALLIDDRVVWQLNCSKAEGKPYFHPLNLVDGTPLVWLRPPDHPWHRGLWFSWKLIDGINYWDPDLDSPGRSEVVSARLEPRDDASARMELALAYRPARDPVVLEETRVLEVARPGEGGGYRIDWRSTFRVGENDVRLDRTPIPGEEDGVAWGGYGGLGARIARELGEWRVVDSEGRRDMGCHGLRARWMDFSGRTEWGREAGIAILDRPRISGGAETWYVSMDAATPFGYFGPAPLYSGPSTLRAGATRELRYSILAHPGRPDPRAIEETWRKIERRDVLESR